MRISRITGNFNSPAFIKDPKLINIGKGGSTGPMDG
jgi:hypothetical protein